MSKVYIIAPTKLFPVKIGTSGSPARRLEHLQIGHYEKLELVAVFRSWQIVESLLHAELKHKWIRGEWFDLDAALAVDLIREILTSRNIQFTLHMIPETFGHGCLVCGKATEHKFCSDGCLKQWRSY